MAKKKYDYRAAQAHKRNQQKIADQKAKEKELAFLKKYGWKILIAVAALVVVIVAVNLITSYFWGPGGSIPQWFGELRNVEADWIVTNTGTTDRAKYFKLGEYTAPEGYTLEEGYNGSTDPLNQTQYYHANDETAPAQTLFVSGVKGVDAVTQLNTVLGYYKNNSGAKQATIAGHDVHYAYMISERTQAEDEEGAIYDLPEEEWTGIAMLCLYTDTVQDSSILVMLQAAEAPLTEVVTEDVLMAEAEKFMPLLTVEK